MYIWVVVNGNTVVKSHFINCVSGCTSSCYVGIMCECIAILHIPQHHEQLTLGYQITFY